MPAPKKLDYDQVRTMYIDEELSTVEIAKRLQCNKQTVRYALLKLDVPLRNKRTTSQLLSARKFPEDPTKEWLSKLMETHGNNAKAAADSVGVNYWTFLNQLKLQNVPTRGLGEAMIEACRAHRIEIPIEEAIQLSLSGVRYSELAHMYGVSSYVIAKRLREVGHKAPKDLHRRYPKSSFDTAPPPHRKVLRELNISACQICGETRALDLAHIKPRRKGGPNDPKNCLVLCATHHRCFDNGTLTVTEFERVGVKVRVAEEVFDFKLSHFVGWSTFS